MICQVCGKEFDAERVTAKYCTPGCRKLAFRGKGSVPKVNVPDGGEKVSVPVFMSASDPKVIEAGLEISDEKKREMMESKLPSVSLDEPCKVSDSLPGEVHLDLEKDLHLDLKKDLGITSWTTDGIFLRNDITIDQVQNIARLIHAKHSRPCPEFLECR